MSELIYKSSGTGFIKDVDTSTLTVSGYYSTFGNVDSDGDIMLNGCYTKTIMESGPKGKNRIMHLLQHDRWQPLGKPSVLIEDAKGLYFETKLIDTSYGSDAIKLYEAGVITEHSVGFNTIKSDTKDGFNEIKEVRLWEGSSVTWGANELALVTGMKGEDSMAYIENEIKRITKGLKTNGLTDEMYISLELSLKDIYQIAYNLGADSVNSQPKEVTINPTDEELKALKAVQELRQFIKNK